MANKQLFGSTRGRQLPPTDTVNRAGGTAYQRTNEQALAQYACTGCLGSTYYASAGEQLDEVLQIVAKCDSEFVAKVAVYAREKGYMKDMPALLMAHLATRNTKESRALVAQNFSRVLDNGKMIRNFCQMIRSGKLGRKSFGTFLKRQISDWLTARTHDQLFRDSVGKSPSIADIIKMVHPRPQDETRKALYGYLTGRDPKGRIVGAKGTGTGPERIFDTGSGWDPEALPELVQHYERYKVSKDGLAVPNVPFQMLDSLNLGTPEWTEIARNARWMMTRMNINTFKRHGVLDSPEMVDLLANRLADKDEVLKARAFPYQLLMAFKAASEAPGAIQLALQQAMEHALHNVPEIKGQVVVCPDVSGSMSWSSITGFRGSATSQVRPIDVAALVAAAMLRKNPLTRVIPFESTVRPIRLNPMDSVMTITQQIASIGGGGTNVSAPLNLLASEGAKVDLVLYVSDNESWVDTRLNPHYYGRGPTQTMTLWEIVRQKNPHAKMVCIDVTPTRDSQTLNRDDILNVGGFSDNVFDLLALFMEHKGGEDHWVNLINEVSL